MIEEFLKYYFASLKTLFYFFMAHFSIYDLFFIGVLIFIAIKIKKKEHYSPIEIISMSLIGFLFYNIISFFLFRKALTGEISIALLICFSSGLYWIFTKKSNVLHRISLALFISFLFYFLGKHIIELIKRVVIVIQTVVDFIKMTIFSIVPIFLFFILLWIIISIILRFTRKRDVKFNPRENIFTAALSLLLVLIFIFFMGKYPGDTISQIYTTLPYFGAVCIVCIIYWVLIKKRGMLYKFSVVIFGSSFLLLILSLFALSLGR